MSALAEKLIPKPEALPSDYSEIRSHALQRLMQYGFPDTKTEAWKYTSLRFLEKRDLGEQTGATTVLPNYPIDAVVLHFDHGRLTTDLSTLPAGVRVSALQADAISLSRCDEQYGEQAGAFQWLNLARFNEAWDIEITGDQAVVIATTTSPEFDRDVYPRIRIRVMPNARLELIQDQRDSGQGLVNIVCELSLAQGSSVRHLIHRQNSESVWVQRTDIDIAKDADYRVVAFDRGGRLTRHDLKMRLMDAGAHGEIDGLVLLNGNQHVDWRTEIVHATGHTNSREAFKMLADGQSVGVFNGRIHIFPNADDSHSDLNTANLLLSDDARVNIKPELEIYSEEVTASHGATIGQLDDRSLFYLRSRGMSEADALALLKFGFAAEPLEQIQNEALKEWALSELKEVL